MQITESLVMAVTAIKSNKLRSTLTLLGIGVGVFSIIGVMTAMGVLQNAIENGLSDLGTNTFQIQKFPAMNFDHDHNKFRNRKNITMEQGEEFINRMKYAKYIGLVQGFPTNNWMIKDGRAFSQQEVESGANVVVLAQKVVDKIFPNSNPVGEDVRIDGIRFRVVGTTEPKGGFLGGNQDNYIAIPLTTGLTLYGKQRSLNIMVQSADRESHQEAQEYARAVLRTIRRVEPGAEDDFEIFSNETLIKQFNDFTFLVKIGSVGIACIALIAAGVGIMNIMLVSVTERTKEIGVRKALGATKLNLLLQFLSESVIFSQIGGLIGIITGSMLGNVLSIIMEAPAIMPWNTSVAILQTPILDFTPLEMNIVALIFCSFIGIVFGVYPAWKAANMDPIESLRYE
jgi:putative ABC transport system permease protein